MNGAEKFRTAQFAYHEDGRIAMRSGRFPVDPWEDSSGIHHSDAGMNHVGFMPVPNLADALIEQQKTMQASLDEAVRQVAERAWAEGSRDAHLDARGALTGDAPKNPYRKEAQ